MGGVGRGAKLITIIIKLSKFEGAGNPSSKSSSAREGKRERARETKRD